MVVIACKQNKEYSKIFTDPSLFCLEDYNSYSIEGNEGNDVYRELIITFE